MDRDISPEDYELSLLFRDSARKRCLQVAQEIVDEIQQSPLTPRLYGALTAGYKAVERGRGADVVTPVHYWRFQEFGTSKMRARPHVRPAIEVVRRRHT